ncbi:MULTISPECIES: SgcJ/EcaC family oxidoreductase [unclassified Bradyrhizobium]|uniref:SgcJ/EcaC family oxidoreductase n=1 Tax=unclassified Bradyrhizobium TaxID=2631580 RepID=UPI002FF3857E
MQSSPKLANAALALCMVALSFGPSASAEPKAEVAAATSGWGQALGEGDPEKVLPLYSDDAVLWGTLSPTVRSDRAALRDYFVGAFKVLPSLKVTFGDQLIRVYGNAAVNTGYYTFSYVKDGETKTLPARYSFTYVKNGQRWLIVDHHSSAMPSTSR